MENKKKLSDYICLNPFYHLELCPDDVYCCCYSWNTTVIGKRGELEKIYDEGQPVIKIQESILDGSYKYCDHNKCPYIMDLIYDGEVVNIFRKKSEINIEDLYDRKGKSTIKLCVDLTCNLSCPSCRTNLIIANGAERELIKENLKNISSIYGKDIRRIYISGSADPFASRVFRDFLINFDETEYPNLETIFLHTNGNLLDEDMWNKIYKSNKFITDIEFSIDASNKETYAKVRKFGNWEKLMKNIKFIFTIPTIKRFHFSFVVQNTNYKEMSDFVDMIASESNMRDYYVNFNKILDWDLYDKEEFKMKEVWKEDHPEFNDFLIELNKIINKHNTHIDMPDIIKKYNLKGIKRLL